MIDFSFDCNNEIPYINDYRCHCIMITLLNNESSKHRDVDNLEYCYFYKIYLTMELIKKKL